MTWANDGFGMRPESPGEKAMRLRQEMSPENSAFVRVFAAKEAVALESEAVDHPLHYGGEDDPFEVIKVIEAWGWGEGFCAGNAIKYLRRAGLKNTGTEQEDLRKGLWYFERYLEIRARVA